MNVLLSTRLAESSLESEPGSLEVSTDRNDAVVEPSHAVHLRYAAPDTRYDCRVGLRTPEGTATMPSAGKRAALAGSFLEKAALSRR